MVDEQAKPARPGRRGPATTADVIAELNGSAQVPEPEGEALPDEKPVIFKQLVGELAAKPTFVEALAHLIDAKILEKFVVKAHGRGVAPDVMFRQSLHLAFETGAFEVRDEGVRDSAGGQEADELLLKILGAENFSRLKGKATEKNATVLALFQAGFYAAFVERDI